MDAIAIGQRLREIRKQHKLTIAAVSEKLNLGNGYWGEVERGAELPSVETLSNFLSLFHVSADYILYGKLQEDNKEQANFLENKLSNLAPYDLMIVKDMIKLYLENEKARPALHFSQALLAKRFRYYREKTGMTIEELSQKAGLNKTYLSQIERYGSVPTLKTLDKLATALQIPIDWILADIIPAGKPILLGEIIDAFNQFLPAQKEIAKNIVEAYLNSIEKTPDK